MTNLTAKQKKEIEKEKVNRFEQQRAIIAELLSNLRKEKLPKNIPNPWTKEVWTLKLLKIVNKLKKSRESGFGLPYSNEEAILSLFEITTKLDIEQIKSLVDMAEHMQYYRKIPSNEINDFDEDDDFDEIANNEN